MIRRNTLSLFAVALLVSACQSSDRGPFQPTAASAGPPAVAPVYHQNINSSSVMPVVDGTLLSNWFGPTIDARIDDAGRRKEKQAEQRAYIAPLGQQITWNGSNDDVAGTIIPVRDGYNQSGAYCREFQETISLSGQQQKGYGKACQQPDGSWKIAL